MLFSDLLIRIRQGSAWNSSNNAAIALSCDWELPQVPLSRVTGKVNLARELFRFAFTRHWPRFFRVSSCLRQTRTRCKGYLGYCSHTTMFERYRRKPGASSFLLVTRRVITEALTSRPSTYFWVFYGKVGWANGFLVRSMSSQKFALKSRDGSPEANAFRPPWRSHLLQSARRSWPGLRRRPSDLVTVLSNQNIYWLACCE